MPYTITPEAPYQPLLDNEQLQILIPDSGSRGHALAWHLAQSPRAEHVFVAPGNAGTELEGGKISNVNIPATDVKRLAAFAVENGVHLLLSGMEDPLAAGIVDEFARVGIPAFGPTQAAAQIESSKLFAKALMKEHGIPTAVYAEFKSQEEGLRFAEQLQEDQFPVVAKDSFLRQGKGVTICQTPEQLRQAIREMPGAFLIEEYLDGQEISLHAICGLDENGEPVYVMLDGAQDHKPVYDGDQGQNTGGMGVITPLPWLSGEAVEAAGRQFVKPTLYALAEAGHPFGGNLYPGLKLTSKGPRTVEFNARFGGPESESYVRSLITNLLDLAVAAVTRRLKGMKVERRAGYAACVIVAAPGYPGSYPKGLTVEGIEDAERVPEVKVFHAGTELNENGQLVSTGGRVLAPTAYGETLDEALGRVQEAVDRINIPNSHHRTDIGRRPPPEHIGFGE